MQNSVKKQSSQKEVQPLEPVSRFLTSPAGCLARCFLIVSIFLSLPSCSLGGSSQTLTGFVQTSATDENDNPVEIFLFDGKQDYRIEKNDAQKELLDLVDRKIRAKAVVSEAWGGKMQIEIEEYTVLE